MIMRKSISSSSLAACVAMLAAVPSFAQAAPDSGTAKGDNLQTTKTDSGDIIVTAKHYVPVGADTATKTNIPLIEAPQSVSVVTRDQMDLLHFVDTQQAVRYTAGVAGENYGADPRYDFLTVRGFTPKQYIDGLAAPITTTIFSVGVDLYAFESLDILKGPASVLYGNSPPGGIYNEVSRRASNQFGGEIRGEYGTDAYATLAGTITGPVSDTLDARFTGLFRSQHGDPDHVRDKRVFAAPTATWHLGSNTKLTGLLYYQYDEDHGGQGGFLPVEGTLLPNPNGRIPRSTNLGDPRNDYTRRQYAGGFEFEHDFTNALSFHSNAKWSHYKEQSTTALYDGGGFVNTTDPTSPDYYRVIQQYNFPYEERVRSFATDNRLDIDVRTGPVSQKIIAGVDYRNVLNVAAFGFGSGGTLDVYDPVYPATVPAPLGYPYAYNDERLKQTGVYGQDQINFGRLHVLLSGRYDWVKVRDYNADTNTAQNKFTYRAGVTYVTPSGIAPYVSYATSFEPVLGSDVVTGKSFKPSTGRQWEGGVKYDARGLPSDVKLFATAALFDIKQNNVVSTAPSTTPVSGTQAGQVEVYGGELEVVGRFYEQLTINGSYSYLHTRVLKSDILEEVGAELPTAPKHKASLFADYTFRKGAIAGFGFGFGVRYTSRNAGALPGAGAPVYYSPAETLFDAALHYDLPGWRFSVNASNLFDKTYVARCESSTGCSYGPARQVIGTITKRF